MKVFLLVPAFNESHNIPIVIGEIQAISTRIDCSIEIVVIDDGSTDSTIQVVEELRRASTGIRIAISLLQLPYNCGVGVALRTGFEFAKRSGADFAIQVDGDGQHDPESLGIILQGLIDGADMVIGSRFLYQDLDQGSQLHTSKKRTWVLHVVSKVVSLASGFKITDATSGYRGVNRKAIDYFSVYYPSEYLGDTMNSILIAREKGFVVKEVPVRMRARISGKRSQNNIRSFFFLMRALANVSISLIERA